MQQITVHVISVLVADLKKVLVVVCKACLFTAASSEVFDPFDHCKLYTLMTIDCVLYAEA